MRQSPGKYRIWLPDGLRSAKTQPEALAMVFEYCAKIKPEVVAMLAKVQKQRTKLVAKDWRDLNPDRPDLSEKRTRVFGDYWIYNTRSGDKVLRQMDYACRLAGLKFMLDIKVERAKFNDPDYVPPPQFDESSLL